MWEGSLCSMHGLSCRAHMTRWMRKRRSIIMYRHVRVHHEGATCEERLGILEYLPARFRLSLGCGHASHGCVFRGWYVCKAVIGRGCGQFTPRASGLIPPLLLLLLLLCCCCSCCRGGWVHLPRACTLVITLVESEVHLSRARTLVESGLTPLPPLRRAHHPSHSRRVG